MTQPKPKNQEERENKTGEEEPEIMSNRNKMTSNWESKIKKNKKNQGMSESGERPAVMGKKRLFY